MFSRLDEISYGSFNVQYGFKTKVTATNDVYLYLNPVDRVYYSMPFELM